MKFNVSRIVEGKNFDIIGISYIGEPRSNTAMFVTKKVEHLLHALESVNDCLIFAEEGITVPGELHARHAFHFSEKPQLAYARFANAFADEKFEEEKKIAFKLMPGGFFVSEDVTIPEDAYIEPGCVIGPDVQIGKNARISAGSVIKHACIGDNFLSNEYAVIGANGFTMAEDENGNKLRIPSLGRVVIGNCVEVGAHDNISCGSGGDTVIKDYVKIDALVHIGHDVKLSENVEITAGGIIGEFDLIGAHSYVGINAALRNRISVGANAVIGMGSTVTKSVESNMTDVGNPARPFLKR